ncbi:carbohydrate-binding protein [Rhizobium sp. GR12]|uniref:carbohydrate-binding protein n=1 Tax=Rhizobium sp. GR12 TaxID=3053925 RepID=UPI002FBE3D81
MKLSLQILDPDGHVEMERAEENEVFLVHDLPYQRGSRLRLTTDQPGCHIVFSLDEGLPGTLAYLAGEHFEFPVPFESDRIPYPPQAFMSTRHRLLARSARPEEVESRRNLALNPWDCHTNQTLFPHAFANVETRGEAVFAARNAIDGEMPNDDHGVWPFSSWGINQNPDAALSVQFGRHVEIDEVVIRMRADFPHDAWWERATIAFSDGSETIIALKKTGSNQAFCFPSRRVEWVKLQQLIKADDPSPFPALTQIEVWGHDV